MTTDVEQCGICRFWLKRSHMAGEMGGGYCRRYPPSFMLEGQFLNDGWPNTHQQSWCGEFKAKEPPHDR